MRVFKSRAEAEAAGFRLVAFEQRPAFFERPAAEPGQYVKAIARTDLEAQLAEALEAVVAVADRKTTEFDLARAALKAFRGETS